MKTENVQLFNSSCTKDYFVYLQIFLCNISSIYQTAELFLKTLNCFPESKMQLFKTGNDLVKKKCNSEEMKLHIICNNN